MFFTLLVCWSLTFNYTPVGSHLTQLFDIARTRAHDLWHYQSRIIRKILAHTVGVFLNIQLQRPSLDLDGLLAV